MAKLHQNLLPKKAKNLKIKVSFTCNVLKRNFVRKSLGMFY